jgi:UPF0176 protein
MMNKIVALYKFADIEDPEFISEKIRNKLDELNIYGTILIGHEGINGTISSGIHQNLLNALKFIESINGFDNLDLKFSQSEKRPFVRLKVKLKKEIVTIGDTSINPNNLVGEYVDPHEWNKLITEDDTLIIDTRNEYECSIGTFKNSINPKTNTFREFPNWIKAQKFSEEDKKEKKIAMFCTGGIRCEKASSLMKKEGFENVYHLKGGILKYFESVNEDDSLWSGECFVFDDRVSVDQNLEKGSYDMCHGCRMPITSNDKKTDKYIRGVACPSCFDKTTEEQKNRYMSRQKQVDLAKKRNQKHIGPKKEVQNIKS